MKVKYARTFFQRACGMLFGKGAKTQECLVIIPCHDIHTFGMRWNIDIAFVDECGSVLMAKKNVAPFHRVRCSRAYAVVERRSVDAPWFELGQRLSWLGDIRGSQPHKRKGKRDL